MKEKKFRFYQTSTEAFISLILSVFSFSAIRNAKWAYGWIAESYPLKEKFIPTALAVISIIVVINLIYLIYTAVSKTRSKAAIVIHGIFSALSDIIFIYSVILLFGLDSGVSGDKILKGLSAISSDLIYIALFSIIGIALIMSKGRKQTAKALISSALICSIIMSMSYFSTVSSNSSNAKNFVQPVFSSENLLTDAEITEESLNANEKADAKNLLTDSKKCWTPEQPDASVGTNSSYAEIKLSEKKTFNTAVIEELGNEVQYFRLQVNTDGEWKTVYQSEKIQSLRLCSFDEVTTDCIRLSIDKFRSSQNAVKIKSLKLYNEQKRNADSFEVTAYQRLDGDMPTEILAKGEDYVKNYAKFYDVYSTIIVFAAVHWDAEAKMNFGEMSEEEFARQLSALKEIIAQRSNPDHKVKLIVTALADGTWSDRQGGVNAYMAKSWESVADQIVEFANKYDFDGVDIDWEYPQSADDWKNFDSFIQKLSKDLKKTKPELIISTALSAGQLGLSQETYDCIDQIQFMAYDGNDTDGYQSSLEQAEEGLSEFASNGADISKINIGIAAYGRPINSTPFWATWRDLPDANYYNNKYYTVNDSNQVYEGTFCSPALAGDKTAYALLSGAGGVMVFRVGCDKTMDNPNSVACGIKNATDRLIQNF